MNPFFVRATRRGRDALISTLLLVCGALCPSVAGASFPATVISGFKGYCPNLTGGIDANCTIRTISQTRTEVGEKFAAEMNTISFNGVSNWAFDPSATITTGGVYGAGNGLIRGTKDNAPTSYSITYEGVTTVMCPSNTIAQGNNCFCKAGWKDAPSGSSCAVVNESNDAQGPQACTTCFGNPIFPLTGAKREKADLGLRLRDFALVLTYDSTAALAPAQAGAAWPTEPQPFGPLWNSSFHRRLRLSPDLKKAQVSRGDGLALLFSGDGAGGFTADGYNKNKLETVAGGYRFTDLESGHEALFETNGRLVGLYRTDGLVLTFAYSGQNLVAVRDNDGRVIRFGYTYGLVTRITAPDWSAILLTYDGSKNLVSITWADGNTVAYKYENVTYPWALTGKMDEKGTRFSTFEYDNSGRAASTYHNGGVDSYSVSYSSPPLWRVTETFDSASNKYSRAHTWDPPTGTVVTTPNGQERALEAQVLFGLPTLASISQPAGSGSVSGASALSYDVAGNVSSTDSPDGARACFAYDSLNRKIVHVEGLPLSTTCSSVLPAGSSLPAGSRRVETSWHAQWNLPVQVTAPLRKTTSVFHGQVDPFTGLTANCTSAPALPSGRALPVLCKSVAQALTAGGSVDSSLPAQVSSYTYDAAGRILSSQDPNGRTTSFARYGSASFSGGAAVDASMNSVILLLHGEDCAGCPSILDSSINRMAPSSASAAVTTTADKKFGSSSIQVSGSGGLRFAGSPGLFMDGDFTVEGFVKVTSAMGLSIFTFAESETWGRVVFMTNSSGVLMYDRYGTAAPTFGGSSAIPTNTWFHFAVARSGSVVRCFVNGVLLGSTTDTAAFGNGVGGIQLHGSAANPVKWDEFRVTKGVARYTSNFTPPSQAFPDVGGPDGSALGHSAGDVQSITNAAGQVTQFVLYDVSGRVRQASDMKGVITTTTYGPRGRVTSASITAPGGVARTTTYTYDGIGQLTGMQLPDGTGLTYAFDDAHRLTGVTDARGNSITYTLNSDGSRVNEEVRDSSGILRRSISRSFDALNRLQQATGSAQ